MATDAQRYKALKRSLERGEIEVIGRIGLANDDNRYAAVTETVPADLLDRFLDQEISENK